MPVLATCRESPHSFSFSTWNATLPAPEPAAAAWSPADSASLYRVHAWGAPYFTINSNGNISVRPHGVSTLPHQEIDLLKAVSKSSAAAGLGLRLPLLLRFPDVLRHRLHSLQSSFDAAVKSHGYRSHYQGVYPVKCNQDRHIVDDIVNYGSGFRFGLEAGSKPELLLAMAALCRGSPDALLVCNGFKDSEYISLALFAKTLKLNTVIVLEQEEELDLVIQLSRNLNIRPVIGVRAKLRTKHSGHFGSTSGEDGKFGLTTTQILRVVHKLDQNRMLDCLQLLHFHIGSQIPTTSLLAEGVEEAAQIYCELVRLGASMEVFDIGGGLGIDYDGSKSDNSDVSVAYSLQEYASAVVQAVGGVCDRHGVDQPVLCSESGRAIVSHHSVLVFEAFSADLVDSQPIVSPYELQNFVEHLSDEAVADFRDLSAAAIRNERETCLVCAERLKEKCVKEFKQGRLPMEHLCVVDGLCEMVRKAIGESEEEEDSIRTYHVNLSIFTSIPDSWGIGQLFPILPIHRLDEKPTIRGILSDLTCDSDGKIDKFIGGENSLPLHRLEGGNGNSKSYYIGMFLGGAYQEALGGLHNLFGRVSVVSVVQSDGPHGFAVTHAAPGASCGDVLRAMQHEPELMFETLKQRIEILSGKDSVALVRDLACSFNNMPYLETSAAHCSLKGGNGEKEDYYDYGPEEKEWDYCMT